jgi:hypothetical protein
MPAVGGFKSKIGVDDVMVIERERYVDDSGLLHVSLALRSRTGAMHSLLTSLTPDERAAVGDALGGALDAIVAILERRAREDEA